MNRKEKILKRLNAIENSRLSFRARVLMGLGYFPDISNGRIKGDYDAILPSSFKVMDLSNWGSARPDNINAFSKECVVLGEKIKIWTYPKKVVGRGWSGEDVPRDYVSGYAYTDAVYDPVGTYYAELEFDFSARGSWDAWWFFREDREYGELDMMERFPGKMNRLTTTCWNGNMDMYNHSFRIPERKVCMAITFGERMELRVNGLLVWVGLQWAVKSPLSMIVNSGLQEDMDDMYFFNVSNIRHYGS